MQEHGLKENQVSQVRGYADQKLRDPIHPLDPANRRISIIVNYLEKKEPENKEEAAEAAPPVAKEEHE